MLVRPMPNGVLPEGGADAGLLCGEDRLDSRGRNAPLSSLSMSDFSAGRRNYGETAGHFGSFVRDDMRISCGSI
jgi:hypothetical protein